MALCAVNKMSLIVLPIAVANVSLAAAKLYQTYLKHKKIVTELNNLNTLCIALEDRILGRLEEAASHTPSGNEQYTDGATRKAKDILDSSSMPFVKQHLSEARNLVKSMASFYAELEKEVAAAGTEESKKLSAFQKVRHRI